MTSLDDLWYLAEEAHREAERAFYRLRERYDPFLERETTRHVSRRRFRTLAERIRDHGAPYGAHTIVYHSPEEVLLCWDSVTDQWVLPGGAVDPGESYRETAARELREEASVAADYDGVGYVARVAIRADEYETWGVLPVFAAEALDQDPTAADPDGEITAVRFFSFEALPEDTRDRGDLLAWYRASLK
jgi:8-oxo-dGTP diphosphatase